MIQKTFVSLNIIAPILQTVGAVFYLYISSFHAILSSSKDVKQLKYQIHELSARAIMRYAIETSFGVYKYNLTEDATSRCISFSAPTVQDDCALFYQDSSPITMLTSPMIPIGCILPVANFDAYFGNTSFNRKWLNKMSEDIIQRQKQSYGVCRYRVVKL